MTRHEELVQVLLSLAGLGPQGSRDVCRDWACPCRPPRPAAQVLEVACSPGPVPHVDRCFTGRRMFTSSGMSLPDCCRKNSSGTAPIEHEALTICPHCPRGRGRSPVRSSNTCPSHGTASRRGPQDERAREDDDAPIDKSIKLSRRSGQLLFEDVVDGWAIAVRRRRDRHCSRSDRSWPHRRRHRARRDREPTSSTKCARCRRQSGSAPPVPRATGTPARSDTAFIADFRRRAHLVGTEPVTWNLSEDWPRSRASTR